MLAEIFGREQNKGNGYKDCRKHTFVHTELRDTTGRRREREEHEEERENKRTASLDLPNDGQILQNILLTVFTEITGSGLICVRNSQLLSCAFVCGGLDSK